MERALTDSGWSNISDTANKFIAHAADEHSRADIMRGFSLDALAKCHEGICRVFATIHGGILYEGGGAVLPVPQFDNFENMTQPWVTASDAAELAEFWRRHADKVETWASGLPQDDPRAAR